MTVPDDTDATTLADNHEMSTTEHLHTALNLYCQTLNRQKHGPTETRTAAKRKIRSRSTSRKHPVRKSVGRRASKKPARKRKPTRAARRPAKTKAPSRRRQTVQRTMKKPTASTAFQQCDNRSNNSESESATENDEMVTQSQPDVSRSQPQYDVASNVAGQLAPPPSIEDESAPTGSQQYGVEGSDCVISRQPASPQDELPTDVGETSAVMQYNRTLPDGPRNHAFAAATQYNDQSNSARSSDASLYSTEAEPSESFGESSAASQCDCMHGAHPATHGAPASAMNYGGAGYSGTSYLSTPPAALQYRHMNASNHVLSTVMNYPGAGYPTTYQWPTNMAQFREQTETYLMRDPGHGYQVSAQPEEVSCDATIDAAQREQFADMQQHHQRDTSTSCRSYADECDNENDLGRNPNFSADEQSKDFSVPCKNKQPVRKRCVRKRCPTATAGVTKPFMPLPTGSSAELPDVVDHRRWVERPQLSVCQNQPSTNYDSREDVNSTENAQSQQLPCQCRIGCHGHQAAPQHPSNTLQDVTLPGPSRKRHATIFHEASATQMPRSSVAEQTDSLLCPVICLHDPSIDRVTPRVVAAAKSAGLGRCTQHFVTSFVEFL